MVGQGDERQADVRLRNLICNFRAPDLEHYDLWRRFKEWCGESGNDVCRVTLCLVGSFMKAVESQNSSVDPKRIVTAHGQVISIQQQNTFVYQVGKSRREPFNPSLAKPGFRSTVGSLCLEAYVMDKARRLGGEFSFQDFKEFPYDVFRRIIVRLKRKGRIVSYPQRSIPQMFLVAEKLSKTDSMPSTIE